MKKQCEYCEDELIVLSADNTNDLSVEIYPGKMIYCGGWFKDESGEMIEGAIQIPLNYCPNCGRKFI